MSTSESSAASSHDCVCLHAPGYRPKVCECSVYTDEHGDWCGNENCRAPLNRERPAAKVCVLASNFFWHLRNGCVRTRKWSWGFCWLWRYKSHAVCLRHGLSGPDFNYEWNYWYCRGCRGS